jgi:CheY-like chemotaxis protein
MAEQKKAVLMMHIDQEQGQLWQTALSTQQLDVIWEKTQLDVVKFFGECDRKFLPDLLLMDMSIKSPSSETLQSSSVCQWITKQQAPIKVVLFNPRQEKIKEIEHSWALRRGAADVLPRLSSENLMAEVARVTALIGCSLISQPLEAIARSLGGGLMQVNETLSANTANSEVTNSKSKSETKIKPKEESKSDNNAAVMYRGVRIRR